MVEDKNLLFSINFIILDMSKDPGTPIVLGQHFFFPTIDDLTYVLMCLMTLRVQDKREVFHTSWNAEKSQPPN